LARGKKIFNIGIGAHRGGSRGDECAVGNNANDGAARLVPTAAAAKNPHVPPPAVRDLRAADGSGAQN